MGLDVETRLSQVEQAVLQMAVQMEAFFERIEHALEREREERQRALEEERRAREQALEEERRAQQQALEEERRARQQALEEERRARQQALEELRRAMEAMLAAQQRALEEERQKQQQALEEERRARQQALEELRRAMEAMLAAQQRALEEERQKQQQALEEEHRARQQALEEERRTRQQALAEMRREWERQLREMNKQWGHLAAKYGTLVEDLLSPSTPYVVETVFGCPKEKLVEQAERVRKRQQGRSMEFDVLAICPDFVLVMEIKSQGRAEYVKAFVEKLKQARDFLPTEYRSLPIYGAFAAPHLDPDVIAFGERQGLIMLAVGLPLLEVKNSPGFHPKAF